MCQPCGVARPVFKTPVCVLGLGLIGGSILRAATAAGRQAFGYNRSVEGAQAARFDGFDATTDLTDVLTRAADSGALIVLAVPMPALPMLLTHISESAPDCPLTDVTSVKSAVLDAVKAAGLRARFVGGHPMTGTAHSGWAAGHARLFTGAPWVISVDDHVDPAVWSMVMELALDCGSVVVPPRSHICHICWPKHWRSPLRRSRWPSHWPRGLSGTARGWPAARRIWCGPCAKPTRANCCRQWTGPSNCLPVPGMRWRTTNLSPSLPRPGMPPGRVTTVFRGRRSSRCSSAPRIGAKSWLPRAGPAG